jgi:hypothetical protein
MQTYAGKKGNLKERTLDTIQEGIDPGPEESDEPEEWEDTVPLLNSASQLQAAEQYNNSNLLPLPRDSTQTITTLSPSLGTSVTDTTDLRASTFSAEPGPGYITAKALYWTGRHMINALERLRIINLVKSHIDFLQTKQTSIDIRFQILEDALELSR